MKNKGKNAIIYPMSKEYVEIIKYKDMLGNYNEIIPVSVKGQGIENRDVGELKKDIPLGVRIVTDFEKCLEKSEEVIITEFSESIYEKIISSIEQGKNLVCLCKLEQKIEKEIIHKCSEKNLSYRNFSKQIEDVGDTVENKLWQIDVPILLICGLSEYTNKFELQLKVRNEFIKKGYSVAQIGSKQYSSFFGMHNFPNFMLSNIPDEKKIYLLNSYIKQIEKEETPDIFIIGVPGGVMPYDLEHPNGFGIINYLVSSAINVDYTILSLAYNDYDQSFWDFVMNYMNYKYEYSVNGFHLSNIYHDLHGDERIEKERLIYINLKSVNEKLLTFDRKDVFNLNNEKAISDKIDEVIEFLSS